MRVVIGGAFNGKRAFVKNYLENQSTGRIDLFEGELPKGQFVGNSHVVIGNFEKIIEQNLTLEEDEIVEKIVSRLNEIDAQAELICICTDIGRGIVPLDPTERKVRDTCGRLYQKLLAGSNSVCRIWYGIPQILKGTEW